MKVALYCKGDKTQLIKLKNYAGKHNEFPHILSDEPDTEFYNSVFWNELMYPPTLMEIDAIYVPNISSISCDIKKVMLVYELLKLCNTDLYLSNYKIDRETATGRMFLTFIVSLAQYKKETGVDLV